MESSKFPGFPGNGILRCKALLMRPDRAAGELSLPLGVNKQIYDHSLKAERN